PALHGIAKRYLSCAKPVVKKLRDVFRAFMELHGDYAGRQTDFTSTVDIGVFLRTEQQVAAHVLSIAGCKVGQASKRSVIVPLRIRNANAHRRRLAGGGIVDADVNRTQACAHWYCAPT